MMQGFDSGFHDFPDYILKITHKIWEERGIDTLHAYYAPDIILRTPLGITQGNQSVIENTTAMLYEFPDRVLLGEDVIWSGNPDEGLLSSHRLLSQATHLGYGRFGEPTGRQVKFRIIADCHARNNQIDDEWLIRDYSAITQALGFTARDFAALQIEAEGGRQTAKRPFTPEDDLPGPYQGTGNPNEWGKKYASVLERIMEFGFQTIRESYDRACQLEYPGGETSHSHSAVEHFWMGLRSSFPEAEFSIDHQIGCDGGALSPRAAIRFSLTGIHSGFGRFGAPTGAKVHVMGAAHVEFGPWGIRREYVVFDEIAIWKQIILGSQDKPIANRPTNHEVES